MSRRHRITFRAQAYRSACPWSGPCVIQVSRVLIPLFLAQFTSYRRHLNTWSRISPGVYWLRDPRSRIYNFTPWLESIPAVTDFDFERVTGFVKSSMDNVGPIH